MKTKVFFSYSFKNHLIVEYYYSMLSKYAKDDLELFFYDKVYHENSWDVAVKNAIKESDVFIYFIGNEEGTTQIKERELWKSIYPKDVTGKRFFCVEIESQEYSKKNIEFKYDILVPYKRNSNEEFDKYFSFRILFKKLLNERNFSPDGLPINNQLFHYEKDIINFYKDKFILSNVIDNLNSNFPVSKEDNLKIKEIEEKLKEGVPAEWPKVKKNLRKNDHRAAITFEEKNNPIITYNQLEAREANVLAAALTNFHDVECSNCNETQEQKFCLKRQNFIFPEAGPRKEINVPVLNHEQHFKVAILVSGGIAPGINAVIDGITQRHYKYASLSNYDKKLQVLGFKNGFEYFDDDSKFCFLIPNKEYENRDRSTIITSELINVGGSMIGTSRNEDLESEDKGRIEKLKDIINILQTQHISILYIIGGEGSMKAAHALNSIYENELSENSETRRYDTYKLNIVGIPKTMDNDILWVWQTFGFMSAVEKAREFIDYLAIETSSNPRLGIVQLFGSHSGFVVSHAVLASRTGVCDFALIPESRFTLKKLIEEVPSSLRKKNKNYGLIVMSETAIPDDAKEYLDKYKDKILLIDGEEKALNKYFSDGKKIKGHVDDKLRDASFKIVKKVIEIELTSYRVLTNEPRHLIRAIPPSTVDIINASRLGTLAVDNAIAGYTDFMISQWLTEFCLIPLELVALGRKQIPGNGIFWKSVLEKTGQKEKLY